MLESLIYDWNKIGAPAKPAKVMLDDETLRDGLQSPSVRTPTIGQKIEILHLIDQLGIDTADIGLPGAGPHVVQDVERLAREIVDAKLKRARQLRGAHHRGRHHADRRDQPAHRPPARSRHVHRLVADPPVHRRLDHRLAAEEHRGGDPVRGVRRPRGDVRHRGHHARGSGHAAPALRMRDQRRRASASASPTPSGTPRRGARRRWCGSRCR